MNIHVEKGTNGGIRPPFVGGHAPKCECSKCTKGEIVEKDSGLSMTYHAAEDETTKLEGVEVSPEGNVTIGVPLITQVVVPSPPDGEEN